MPRTPVLYLLVGGIASGKSSIAAIIKDGCTNIDTDNYIDIVHVCPDDIREELSGDAANQAVNAEAWKIAYERLEIAMVHRFDVIFDAAYMIKQKTRRTMQAYAKQHGYRVVYILLPVDLDAALEANARRDRKVPEDVVRRYHDNFQQQFPFIASDRQ